MRQTQRIESHFRFACALAVKLADIGKSFEFQQIFGMPHKSKFGNNLNSKFLCLGLHKQHIFLIGIVRIIQLRHRRKTKIPLQIQSDVRYFQFRHSLNKMHKPIAADFSVHLSQTNLHHSDWDKRRIFYRHTRYFFPELPHKLPERNRAVQFCFFASRRDHCAVFSDI